MEGNMTPKDKEKFERIWKKLGEKELSNDDLKRLVYWLIIALAGEGWFTNELKETVKRLGIEDWFKRE
jgi:hypothetical protein